MTYVNYNKRMLFYCCILYSLWGCKKMSLERDSKYDNSRITAQLHSRAVKSIWYWEFPASIKIKDSVFLIDSYFETRLGDTITNYQWNEVTSEFDAIHILCDWGLINTSIEKSLFYTYADIMEGEKTPAYWRPLLHFSVNVHVRRRGIPDTTVNFYYPFTSSLFN